MKDNFLSRVIANCLEKAVTIYFEGATEGGETTGILKDYGIDFLIVHTPANYIAIIQTSHVVEIRVKGETQ
ncbi:hypothetical protein ACFLXA_02810 [Chloroflexota bacterium]